MSPSKAQIVAQHLPQDISLDAEHPASDWERAQPVSFCSDWQGKNPDPWRGTKVWLLWSEQNLYVRFECRYRNLYLFGDSDPNGRRNQLWERDVAEIFLQPDPSKPRFYGEFEVSANGMWIDLDIYAGGRSELNSGMQRSVWLDRSNRLWAAELEIPTQSLTTEFNPSMIWGVNFYRIEGKEPRTYLAWQATGTQEPNFHVPEAFGELHFAS